MSETYHRNKERDERDLYRRSTRWPTRVWREAKALFWTGLLFAVFAYALWFGGR